eukprot:6617381-Pyramimonas_sp.AAC.1
MRRQCGAIRRPHLLGHHPGGLKQTVGRVCRMRLALEDSAWKGGNELVSRWKDGVSWSARKRPSVIRRHSRRRQVSR